MKIAVIGSGISGLSAAYFLSKKHKVDLFEKEDRFGGHSHTLDILTDNQGKKKIRADIGFIVFNKQTYPNLINFFDEIGVEIEKSNMSLSFLAKDSDPNSGGRQMPQHYGHKDLRIVSQSSPTGTQFLQAVGSAMSIKWENKKDIVYVSSGEGSTSEGEFHEALNWASREKLPVIFHIQDNEYAISVHVSEQTSGSSVFDMVSGYKNLSKC